MNVWRYLPPLMDPTANPLTTDAAIERMKNFRRFILISIGVVILNYLDGNMVRWKKKHATTTGSRPSSQFIWSLLGDFVVSIAVHEVSRCPWCSKFEDE